VPRPSPLNPTWPQIAARRRLLVIAGPCVLENEALAFDIARSLQKTCRQLRLPFIFKASYDKANRTSAHSFRGPGLEEGLAILARIRQSLRVPILTDVHSESEAIAAGKVVDVLQIPAFLCRQTDLIRTAVATGRIVNIKKGQFLAPDDLAQVVAKARSFGGQRLLLTERGSSFGYHNLVTDFRAIPILRQTGCPVVFDATHSVQLPGAGGDRSSGQRQFAPVLARAAVAAGADAVFLETHPDPDQSPSDGPNMIPLADVPRLLRTLAKLFDLCHE
jgi:2-dehydro-3-deoxyphosphooctonate aldolase (KDO 8-P synthase)